MKLSFTTLGCPDWTMEQIVSSAASMGYDGVELRGVAGEHLGPDETPEDLARISSMFRDAGIEISGIMGYSSFTIDDPDKRREAIDVAIKFCGVAAQIDCPVLRVFGGALSEQLDWGGNLQRVTEGLKRVTEVAEDKGVRIALETHDAWTRGEHVRAVIDAVGSPALGACWDVANSFSSEPLAVTCAALSGHIVHVHYKDAARSAGSKLPGTGDVDMLSALELLRDSGYEGYLSFEWEKKWEPELEPPEVAFPHYIEVCKDLMARAGVQN